MDLLSVTYEILLAWLRRLLAIANVQLQCKNIAYVYVKAWYTLVSPCTSV
jgi:hypothetical protein